MTTSISSLLSSLPRGRALGRAIRHRWPALAVATVALGLPTTAALASSLTAAGPTAFTSTDLQPAVFAHNQGSGVAIEALADGNIALRAGTGAVSDADAVVATASRGAGVRAKSTSGIAVIAEANRTAGTFAAGVQALGDEAVVARGTTLGVDSTANDTAVAGSGGVYGGSFSGKTAPLRLFPGFTAGAPTTGTHRRGELYIDSQGQLFLCIADSANGNAGTWKHVHLDP